MILNMVTVRAIYLIVIVWLLAACGATAPKIISTAILPPTTLPTLLPTTFPTNTPIPFPTQTPIPGYVGGEEKQAYASFVAYYDSEVLDCYFEDLVRDVEATVDYQYPGKAVYIGDGVWRFYVRIIFHTLDKPNENRRYKEEVLQVSSFSNQNWENICDTPMDTYNIDGPGAEPEQPEYEPDYSPDTNSP